MTNRSILPDTRPYPATPVKGDLLLYAGQIAHAKTGAERKIAQETLCTKIAEMFAQRHPLWLSVAMSMSPDPETYIALMDGIDEVLRAKTDDEVQWFALPVVVVAGTKQPAPLPESCPAAELCAVLENYPALRPLSHAQWLPQLLRADDFAQITADTWFAAKQSIQAAEQFAQKLPRRAAELPKDQSVHVLYALGYGGREVQAALGQNLREAALPLMQVWQQHLTQPGMTLFTNPLNADTPTAALANASHMRLRMALDVYAGNAIRAVRLQSPRVGVVMAAQEGGRLLFGFNAAESAYRLPNLVFAWNLMPRDNIAVIQQNFLDLMVDCKVENIYLLHEPLGEQEELPDYPQAQRLAGHNPLFAATVDG